jgi:hypothetical protein
MYRISFALILYFFSFLTFPCWRDNSSNLTKYRVWMSLYYLI